MATAVPETGSGPSASVLRSTPPAPDRPAAPEAAKPAGKLPDAKLPEAVPLPAAALAPPPAAPLPSAAPAPARDTAKPPVNTAAVAGPPPGPAPAAGPPAVVASLPPPADAGGSPRGDDRPKGNTEEGRFQPLPELTGDPLPVTIGQIGAEPRGTDVHVVVVNVLQHELKDIDVRCRARDAQGLQVAEASSHIARIAPSDVGFGQVLLPAEITARDNSFTCDVGRIAAANDGAP